MEDFDIITGIHSIKHAIANRNSSKCELFTTDQSRKLFTKKELAQANIEIMSNHELQQEAAKYCERLGFNFQRVPSNTFLIAPQKEEKSLDWLYETLKSKDKFKIIALDSLTDVHNAAAIFRTACFYGVDVILTPSKNSFSLTPSLYRIASGSVEHIELISVSSLPKVITKLGTFDVRTIALSEHSDKELKSESLDKTCLILGKEDTGISHSVLRVASNTLSLKSQGEIKSLNVSVASALAMNKVFC